MYLNFILSSQNNIKIFEAIMNNGLLTYGGNMGDREQYLATAKELIDEQCGDVISTSSLYETAAWGNTDQPPFLNQALKINNFGMPGN